jgi:membrane protein DedA with SNARE-associated domain
VELHLASLLAWLEPRALLLALALPPVIRVVGHWIPEELFMVALGVLAARSDSAMAAAVLLAAVTLSHFVTDQLTYVAGMAIAPHLRRYPRIRRRLEQVTDRLVASPIALFGLIPARVLPIGRGAWLAGCGVVRVPWQRFAVVDLLALIAHLATWSGLGWWLSGDLARLEASTQQWKVMAAWTATGLIGAIAVTMLWRRRESWQPITARAVRRAGRTLLDRLPPR